MKAQPYSKHQRVVWIAAVLFVCSIALAAKADESLVIVTEKDKNREITLGAGRQLLVKLRATPGTGYEWMVGKPNEHLRLAKVTYESREGGDGGGVIQVLRFEPVAVGESRLILHYARPFGSKKPSDTFEVAVQVEGDS